MFTIIGVDWGEKRCGLAYADPATELVITETGEVFTDSIFEKIREEVQKRHLEIIVVGIPYNFKGQSTEVTQKVQVFIQELQQKFQNIRIVAVDERSSTKQSQNLLEKSIGKHKLNHQSAAQILERYFYQLKVKGL